MTAPQWSKRRSANAQCGKVGMKAYWDTKDSVVPWHRQTTVLLWTVGPEGKQGGLSAFVPFLGDIIQDTSVYYNYPVANTDLLRIHCPSCAASNGTDKG